MRTPTFDLDLLRALVAVVDCGGFQAAGKHLHCTQSAISHQIQRLEERAKTSLFEKQGRQKSLTSSGELLVAYARRILDLNEEAYRAVTGSRSTLLRIGLPEYFADQILPAFLMQYSERFPSTRVDVRLARSSSLREMVDRGELDCVVLLQTGNRGGSPVRLPLVWLGTDNAPSADAGPIPLVVFDAGCAFRGLIIDSLQRAAIPWRIAYTANSLADLLAAVRANLGVAALIQSGEGNYGLRPLRGFPELPMINVTIHHAAGTPSQEVREFMDLVTGTLCQQNRDPEPLPPAEPAVPLRCLDDGHLDPGD